MLGIRLNLCDVDGQDRLDAGQREMQEQGRQEQADECTGRRQAREDFAQRQRGGLRRRLARLVNLGQCETAEQAAGPDEEEGMAVADAFGEPAAENRPEQTAGDLCREEHAHGPAGALLRGLGGDQRNRGGLEAGQGALHETQGNEVPDALCEAHRNHDEAEPAGGAQDHRLAAVFIGQASPDRREDREADEVAAKDDAGPARDSAGIVDAELFDVEGQDRRHLTHADRDDEGGGTADQQVLLPNIQKKTSFSCDSCDR